jgi:hypothetical protein
MKIDIHVTVHCDKFLKIKPDWCTNSPNLFLGWNFTCFGQFLCPLLGVFHSTYSNGICHTVLLTACAQDQDGTSRSCSQTTPDDGQKICLKHVEFYSKNKFEKLVHLFGIIVRKLMKIEFLLYVQWTLSTSKVLFFCDGRYKVCMWCSNNMCPEHQEQVKSVFYYSLFRFVSSALWHAVVFNRMPASCRMCCCGYLQTDSLLSADS